MSPQCLSARILLRSFKRFNTRLVASNLHEVPVWRQPAGATRQFSYSHAVAAGDTFGDSTTANGGGAHDPKNTTICLAHPSFAIWGANTGAVTPCLSGAGHWGHHAVNRLRQMICSLMRRLDASRSLTTLLNSYADVGKTLFSVGLGRAFAQDQVSYHHQDPKWFGTLIM